MARPTQPGQVRSAPTTAKRTASATHTTHVWIGTSPRTHPRTKLTTVSGSRRAGT